jgi:flavin reductase (DIM6/NTAB) family NADH-FMN oxidoreductase RutF
MKRKPINIENFQIKPHDLWKNQWLLLTAGDFSTGNYNTMTVAWGSFGTMWAKPFAQVVVRPTRYTFDFMEKYDTFTLTAFPSQYKKALSYLGSHSGRDSDKIRKAGLTAIASTQVVAPSFQEAELVLECEKTYWQDMNPNNFVNPAIGKNYPNKDWHRIYFGEILAILK